MPGKSVEVTVISVPGALTRRSAMTAMLEGSGLAWHYFDAHTCLIDGDLRYDPRQARRRFGRLLGVREIAIYSSHYAVLKAFLCRGVSDHALVIEDDIILDVAFPIAEFAGFCAENRIDYIRLFGKHPAPATRLGFFYDRSIVRYKTSPAGTQAYLVSRAGAERIMQHLHAVEATVDLAMDRFWETQLPLYSIFPYPVIERFLPTSVPIDACEGLSPEERVAWNARRAVEKARKIYANAALKQRDAQMQRQLPIFSQIHSAPPQRQAHEG